MKINKFLLLISLTLFIIVLSCEKKNDEIEIKPTTNNDNNTDVDIKKTVDFIEIDSIYNIATTRAYCDIKIVDTASIKIFKYGICWGKSSEPTIYDDNKSDYYIESDFMSNKKIFLGNLESYVKYYVRAYVITSTGTIYSNQEFSFTTLVHVAPCTFSLNTMEINNQPVSFNSLLAKTNYMSQYSITCESSSGNNLYFYFKYLPKTGIYYTTFTSYQSSMSSDEVSLSGEYTYSYIADENQKVYVINDGDSLSVSFCDIEFLPYISDYSSLTSSGGFVKTKINN